MDPHQIVTKVEWIEARRVLLAKEKELTRLRDRLAQEQRALPWVKIEKSYVFDGPKGKVTLTELFDGRSQLFIKHFMMGPGARTQCVGCSFQVDHIEGILAHLNNHDVTYAIVARAPIEEIELVRKRMGWKFLGFLPTNPTSITILTSPSRGSRLSLVARSTILGRPPNRRRASRIFPGKACFSRTTTETSILPTRASGAAAKSSSAPTESWV